MKAAPLTLEALREQHTGVNEETLLARLIAERLRGGFRSRPRSPGPRKSHQQTGPATEPNHAGPNQQQNNPDIER